MRAHSLAIVCTLGIGSLAAAAQMEPVAKMPLPPAGTIATPAQAFDSQLSLVEREMMSAVKAMPAEKYDFAPGPAIFVPGQSTQFEGARTFAQQVTHVAEANYFFYSIVSGLKPDVDTDAILKLTKKEDAVAALAGSFQFAHKAIATLTAANAFEVIKSPEPGFQTRATLAAFGIAHAWDHYGQIAVYLRMNGIVPPASTR